MEEVLATIRRDDPTATTHEDYKRPGYADPDGLETVEAWDCCECCVVAELNRQSGTGTSRSGSQRSGLSGDGWGMTNTGAEYDDTGGYADPGGASRFFYTAKAPSAERWFYCTICKDAFQHESEHRHGRKDRKHLHYHPTQKSEELMGWLVKLITPPGGKVLDPFAGTFSTGIACLANGFEAIGIEREHESAIIAQRRCEGFAPLFTLNAAESETAMMRNRFETWAFLGIGLETAVALGLMALAVFGAPTPDEAITLRLSATFFLLMAILFALIGQRR